MAVVVMGWLPTNEENPMSPPESPTIIEGYCHQQIAIRSSEFLSSSSSSSYESNCTPPRSISPIPNSPSRRRSPYFSYYADQPWWKCWRESVLKDPEPRAPLVFVAKVTVETAEQTGKAAKKGVWMSEHPSLWLGGDKVDNVRKALNSHKRKPNVVVNVCEEHYSADALAVMNDLLGPHTLWQVDPSLPDECDRHDCSYVAQPNASWESIQKRLDDITERLVEYLKDPKTTGVLIHCKAGENRSALVVLRLLAYFVIPQITAAQLWQHVFQARGIVPNVTYMRVWDEMADVLFKTPKSPKPKPIPFIIPSIQ
eukprot:NODE_2251_length_1640_cov_32.854318_g1928_i0.p1 GENE.NODE_2251_length_1640_cov_32.854318_g1928_i0~~NODE_2251_length_1640_cov_32.854318_g1928_i0.p1  ORF type:complete len:312 (+),score=67.45 NODE_2251_length_1640_cov_32.854318_g1928_i0:64-999(+)